MRRRLIGARGLMLLLAGSCCALATAGCGAGRDGPRGEEVLAEVNSFTSELVRRVEAAPDPSAGVEDAQRFLDSRREELKAKIGAAKKSEQYRRDGALRAKFLESETDNVVVRVAGLRTRHMGRAMSDRAFQSKLDKLVTDYGSIYGQ